MVELSNKKIIPTYDQRYFPRWEVNNRALFQLEDQTDTAEARTIDLSCSGTCINISEPLDIDQKIKLVIYLSPHKFVNVIGKVVWTKSINNLLEAWIHFENIPTRIQDTLLQYAFEVRHDQVTDNWFKGWDNK